MSVLSLSIGQETDADAAEVERLHARAFGPGRFARTAFRLREGVDVSCEFSFTARVGTFLVGSVRMGPIRIGGHAGLMLGPLTVDPSFERRGIGAALMQAAIAAARARNATVIVLVGDAAFYRRFGFTGVPAGRLILPGPVDPARLLWLALQEGGVEEIGGVVHSATGRRGTR